MRGKVCGHYVAVKPEDVEKISEGGIVMPTEFDPNKLVRETVGTTKGTVIDVGANAWIGHGDGQPWAKIGDKVSFIRHASKIIEDDDGKEVFIMVDENIIYVYEE